MTTKVRAKEYDINSSDESSSEEDDYIYPIHDYYDSVDKCKSNSSRAIIKPPTNPRYTSFKQTHFTAGDLSQFQAHRNMTNGNTKEEISIDNNPFESSVDAGWVKNKDISALAPLNTFKYIFNKFKKGIFIQIRNNKVSAFLPFSKANFVNEWGHLIKVDPKYYRDVPNFIAYIKSLEKRRFDPRGVNSNASKWYANNCLVRFEYPISEGDTNDSNIHDMMVELCKHRKVPDIEFFVNRRDFPIMRTDGTEPYNHIWNGHIPLVSHSYDTYSPILSMTTKDGFADIPIPTGEDWARVSVAEGKWFISNCNISTGIYNIAWDDKKDIAVFRGGSTGCGVTVNSNMRLKVSEMSAQQDKDDILIDAGISSWNVRPRKLEGNPFLQTINVPNLSFGLSNRLSKEQQASYKYIIHIDGHVAAFRLAEELSFGSCILKVESPYKVWFSNLLKAGVHYIPIKRDLSDLFEKVRWCRKNDEECKQIAMNAKNFYNTYLQKDGCLDRVQAVLIKCKKEMGNYMYNNIQPRDVQYDWERQNILSYPYPKTDKTGDDISEIPLGGRSYWKLSGIKSVVNMLLKEDTFFQNVVDRGVIMARRDKKHFVQLQTLSDFPFAVKHSPEVVDNVHGAFIGLNCTNKLLMKIPNFMYIFGATENIVISEYIQGETFEHFITNSFNMNDYIFILLQLSLALNVAQNECAFVHYDLMPWNVILQLLPTPVTFDYIISDKVVHQVTTRLLPVIIDYEKSHAVYKAKHYGNSNVSMYRTSTIQDIVSILLSSMKNIIKAHRLNLTDQKILTSLANFVTNTTYVKNPFKNFFELKKFLDTATKYETLIEPKGTLENKTPVDFINHIKSIYSGGFPIQKVEALTPSHTGLCNEVQVFNYILSNNDEERANTFANIFRRIGVCNLPTSPNMFIVYYTRQMFEQILKNTYYEMVQFLRSRDLDTEMYNDLYLSVSKRIEEQYPVPTEIGKIIYEIDGNVTSIETPYTSDLFLEPKVVLEILKIVKPVSNLTAYKSMIQESLLYTGPSELPDTIKKFYRNNFKSLLDANSVAMLNNEANYKTLIETEQVIKKANNV